MSGCTMLMLLWGVLCLCCFGYSYLWNRKLDKIEQDEAAEIKARGGLTPRREAHYFWATERASKQTMIAFILGWIFAALFVIFLIIWYFFL